ncbi:MAG: hypothetical protein AAGF30_00525 [Pseudomonadota bacterium]
MTRTRRMTVSTTVTEDEIRDRLLREHLLDLGVINHIEDRLPKGLEYRITRGKTRAGGYLIETWQNRVPRTLVPLLPPADTDDGPAAP